MWFTVKRHALGAESTCATIIGLFPNITGRKSCIFAPTASATLTTIITSAPFAGFGARNMTISVTAAAAQIPDSAHKGGKSHGDYRL